jgi:hypothetical protein
MLIINSSVNDHDWFEYGALGKSFYNNQKIGYDKLRYYPQNGFFFIGLHGFAVPLFKTFEEFTKSPNYSSFVGFVYWDVEDIPENDEVEKQKKVVERIDKIVKQIEEIQNDYFPRKKFPPSFIVFTHIPLNLLLRRKLSEQGATIYDGQGDSPRDADSLQRHLQAGHIGWYKEGNMWAYKDSLKTPLRKN